MTEEKAIIDYLSKTVGTLVGLLEEHKVLDKEKALELITIVGSGIDEIGAKFRLQKSTLDAPTQT